MKKKSTLPVALLTIIICILALMGTRPINVVEASTTVNSMIITSDTTWTKANSPYTLAGPVAVNQGVTLTIEPGAIVNLNGYYIQVNGTLTARGTNTERIQINGQENRDSNHNSIIFTPLSVNWSTQTNTGSIIENANLNWTFITITNTSTKISNNNINPNDNGNYLSIYGGSPEISGNNNGYIEVYGGSPTFLGNNGGGINSPNYGVIGPITLSDNNFTGGVVYLSRATCTVSRNQMAALRVGGSSTILNNTIYGEVLASGGSILTGNTIIGRPIDNIHISGASIVANNNITGVTVSAESLIAGNIISGTVGGVNCEIVNNMISGQVELMGNTSMHNNVINAEIIVTAGTTPYGQNLIVPTIEKNLISNFGVSFSADSVGQTLDGIIRNNTFMNIGSSCIDGPKPTTIILYNNFENCSRTITLHSGLNVNASYNWWGTTNQAAIRASFHDYYSDFNLGNVTFAPFLTASNSQAMPDLTAIPVPETLPSWIILTSLIIVSLLSAIAFKQKENRGL